MAVTADQLSTRVLRSLNVIGATETASAAQLLICFDALNLMINSWGLERLTKAAVLRTVKTLTSGTASYSIGAGGDINIVWPVSIDFAGLILDTAQSTPTEVPIEVFSPHAWAHIQQKTFQSGRVEGVYFEHDFASATQRGSVYPWPIPNVGTMQLVLYTPTAIAPFADQNATSYTFSPGIEEAVQKNLQCRVHADFSAPLDPEVRRLAGRLLQQIKLANVRPRTLSFDPALPGVSGYRGDIRRGS